MNCPRTYYLSGKRDKGRDSLAVMGIAYSEVTRPRGTDYSGASCPRIISFVGKSPGGHFTSLTDTSAGLGLDRS